VWYPATGKAGAAAGAGAGAAANGHFPVVLFSHGLTGIPTAYEGILTRLAAAGFVVAAPAYPYTKQGAPSYNPLDVLNQPADAWYVIGEVLKLNTRSGDPLAGHLDPSRVGLAGHSAGAYTTAGMLTARREAPVAGAVIIAGGSIGGFAGTATPVLYVHGDQDPTVGIANGRAAYAATPWPKAFVTVVGGGHWQYLAPGAPGFAATVATTTDFLRWTLYGDDAAKARIAGDGSRDGAVRTETALG
jgi:dienelactone hydrolase